MLEVLGGVVGTLLHIFLGWSVGDEEEVCSADGGHEHQKTDDI